MTSAKPLSVPGSTAAKNIGKCEALIGEPWRALAPPPPDMTSPPLLSEPRLVLKEQPDTLVFMRSLHYSELPRGSF
jgi:hypothetical protein